MKRGEDIIKALWRRVCPRPVVLDILLVKAKIVEREERLAKFSLRSRPALILHMVSIHPHKYK